MEIACFVYILQVPASTIVPTSHYDEEKSIKLDSGYIRQETFYHST